MITLTTSQGLLAPRCYLVCAPAEAVRQWSWNGAVAAHSKAKNGLQISERELISLLADVNVGESAAVALISPFY